MSNTDQGAGAPGTVCGVRGTLTAYEVEDRRFARVVSSVKGNLGWIDKERLIKFGWTLTGPPVLGAEPPTEAEVRVALQRR